MEGRIGKVPIIPCLKASTKVLKLLILGSNHLSKLIVLPLEKITKRGILRCYIVSKGGLFLLNGPKGVMELTIII